MLKSGRDVAHGTYTILQRTGTVSNNLTFNFRTGALHLYTHKFVNGSSIVHIFRIAANPMATTKSVRRAPPNHVIAKRCILTTVLTSLPMRFFVLITPHLRDSRYYLTEPRGPGGLVAWWHPRVLSSSAIII